MAAVEIRIPQLGEGLQEARLIRFLKQPGDRVAQDEPIYEMETDKAVMEIESPAAGVLQAWDAKEDDVIPIGAMIGRIDADGTSATTDLPSAIQAPVAGAARPLQQSATTDTSIPESQSLHAGRVAPRTRAYARQIGMSDDHLAQLARRADRRLLPEDIDRYLASDTVAKQAEKEVQPIQPRQEVVGEQAGGFRDIAMPQRQRTLVYRMERGAREVIPATMEMRLDWGPVEAARERLRQTGGPVQPSQFLLFAWCVAQASRSHPRFLSAIKDDSTRREYEHLHLGIAVARPDDELLLARIPDADALSFADFVRTSQDAIQRARDGEDQTAGVMQISLTNMAGAGVRLGIPVLVAPAIATLFVGEPFDEAYPLPAGGIAFGRSASMVLTFDHRIANGVGAANFLNDIRNFISSLSADLPSTDR